MYEGLPKRYKMKLGIIREEKTPPDSRVPLTPAQCAQLLKQYPTIEIVVKPSPNRCYTDQEYKDAGIPFQEELSDCDILMGVKEVPKDSLIPNKIYFFFSHTIKQQVYNRSLLQTILAKKIQLLDYEVLTNEKGQRLIAFGHFAGMVGAHNGLLTYGLRTGAFEMKRMKDCYDYKEAVEHYKGITFPSLKIILSGTGRVASGAAQVLNDMGIRKVSPRDFLHQSFDSAVYTQLACKDYVAKKDATSFELSGFYENPLEYKSIFAPYAKVGDIFINGIYWDNQAPAFFSKEEMRHPEFNIQVIADVTCDIAPLSSIPSTLRASTIADPFFGYDPNTESETAPFQKGSIDTVSYTHLTLPTKA